MSTKEKNEIKKGAYNEALRYMANAKDNLHKAKKHDKFYSDAKYVRTASGIAYNAMLLALDALLETKSISLPKRKSIEWYRLHLRKIDGRLMDHVNNAYHLLHLSGYYDGVKDVNAINSGLDSALYVIKQIKPTVN